MTTTNSAADDARDLPRESTTQWIRALVAVVMAVWLVGLVWQVAVLPERVPIHFGSGGEPDNWSSKWGALAFAGLLPLLIILPMPLLAAMVIRAPDLINAPNKEWWTATGPRLRRFERLLREDLWLITAIALALLITTQVGVTLAARSPDHQLPEGLLPISLAVFGVALVAVMIRMFSGGRYAEHPDLG